MATYHHAVRFEPEQLQQAQQTCRQIQARFVQMRLAADIPVYLLSSQESCIVVVIGVGPSNIVLYNALEEVMGDETLILPSILVEQLETHFHTGKGSLGDWQPVKTQPTLAVGP
ncbi:MAG TPA: hypothetical protein VNG90_04865 [Candidatus Acidoferrum sp.]|nr:hypothetical protein [Candidatus Acidoferrum sp.]